MDSENELIKDSCLDRVNIQLYEKKTFLSFDSFLAEKASLEERHGVSFPSSSRAYKVLSLSLEEYLLEHGNAVLGRQRFVYSSKTLFPVDFLGAPYIVLGNPTYDCEFGGKQLSEKRDAELNGHHDFKRKRNMSKASKKMSCSCRISVRQLLVFKKIVLEADSPWARTTTRKRLSSLLQGWSSGNQSTEQLKETTGAEIVFHAWFPTEEAHDVNHPMKEENRMRERVHPKVVNFIQCLASEGERTAVDIQKSLKHFVLNEFTTPEETPDFNRRRFSPSIKTIRNIVYSGSNLVTVNSTGVQSTPLKRRKKVVHSNEVGEFSFTNQPTEDIVIDLQGSEMDFAWSPHGSPQKNNSSVRKRKRISGPLNRLSVDFSCFLGKKEFSTGVAVLKDGSEIYVHDLVLFCRCPELAKISKKGRKYDLKFLSKSGGLALLNYLYSAAIPKELILTIEDKSQLYLLAEQYDLVELKKVLRGWNFQDSGEVPRSNPDLNPLPSGMNGIDDNSRSMTHGLHTGEKLDNGGAYGSDKKKTKKKQNRPEGLSFSESVTKLGRNSTETMEGETIARPLDEEARFYYFK